MLLSMAARSGASVKKSSLGELVALHDTEYGHHGAQAEEDKREEPYLPEARFDVFQRFEFHCLSFYRVYLFY